MSDLKIKEDYFYYNVVKIVLPVFFICDGLNKTLVLVTGDDSPSFSPSLFARTIFELVALLMILMRLDNKRAFFITIVSIMFISFASGVALYLLSYDKMYDFFFHLALFNKYVFAFIVYYFIYKLRDNDYLLDKLMSLCAFLFFLNSLFVIIGAVFEVQLFRSYVFQDYRYGYNGIIPATNESSLFFFIALSYLYHRRFIRKRKIGSLYFILIGALLVGTKSIYFYIAALVLFHFLSVSTIKAKLLAFIGVILFCAVVIVFLTSSYAPIIIDYFTDFANKRGLLSMLLSGRDLYVETKFFANFEYWTILNYLFGGQDQMHFLIEMDLFDLFLFFGAFGSLLYFLLFFKSIFNINLKKKFNLFFVVIYITLAVLGGHFFSSALNALYLVLFGLYIYSTDLKNDEMARQDAS